MKITVEHENETITIEQKDLSKVGDLLDKVRMITDHFWYPGAFTSAISEYGEVVDLSAKTLQRNED